MAATNTPKTTLADAIRLVSQKQPEITLVAGDTLFWSPKNQTITYRKDDETEENIWGLLHEAGHALLEHADYRSDMELLLLEVDAWVAAEKLAAQGGISIDQEHIEDCLDTYRDWLHQRSTCPRCGVVTFQENARTYRCFNCRNTWNVSASRLCRPYRLSAKGAAARTNDTGQIIFQ